jgi:hypothetical protein
MQTLRNEPTTAPRIKTNAVEDNINGVMWGIEGLSLIQTGAR